KQYARHTNTQQRAEQFVRVLNFGDILMAGPMESGSRKNQDRSINKQGEHERRARINSCKLDSFASAFRRLLEFARLHNRRVQIQVVRHHRGSKDTNANIKHFLVCDDVWPGDKTERNADKAWSGKNQFQRETRADSRD